VRVVLHHDVWPAGGGRPDLEDVDDVRMPGQFAHCDLLAHEPLQVVGLEIGGQHLHRDDAIQRALAAAIHHPEPAAPDLLGLLETGSHQLRRDPGVHIPLRRQRVAVSHRSPQTATTPWRHIATQPEHKPHCGTASDGSRDTPPGVRRDPPGPPSMSTVASRELRNDTAAVLRRVQAGEEVTITVNGQPVAVIAAVQPKRRRWLTKGELVKRLESSQADAGLRADLAELAGETTDDLDEL